MVASDEFMCRKIISQNVPPIAQDKKIAITLQLKIESLSQYFTTIMQKNDDFV